MIAHLRTYNIGEGKMDAWLELFKDKLVPLLAEHGITVDGSWVNEDRSEFIWVRSYGDTPEDIERKEAACYGSEWWLANVDHVRTHLTGRDIKLIFTT